MGKNEIPMEFKTYLELRSNEILHIKICGVWLKQLLKRFIFQNFFKEKKP